MKKHGVAQILGIALILVGCGSSTTSTDGTDTPAQIYSLTDVSAHSTQTDCWLAIDGKVYDVTEWIPKHPGGAENIINNCGKDSTEQYHTKNDSGRDHSLQAQQQLKEFYIGDLK